MHLRQPIERFLTARGGAQAHPATIVRVGGPFEHALLFASVDQLDYGVVLQAKRVRGVCDRGRVPRGSAGHRQQELVMLRVQARGGCRILADK